MSKPQDGDGKLWFDEEGALHQEGVVSTSVVLGALSAQVRRFLARLASCSRTENGDYQLGGQRTNVSGGLRIIWENMITLSACATSQFVRPMTAEEQATMDAKGFVAYTTTPPRRARPLDDALRQITFALPLGSDGKWVTTVPAETAAMLGSIADELEMICGSERASAADPPAGTPPPAPSIEDEFVHADDFAWVIWKGVKYDLVPGHQVHIVRLLWQAWEKGKRQEGCGVGLQRIREACDTSNDAFRVSHAFRGHPLWTQGFVKEHRKGVYSLSTRESPKNPPS